MKYEIFEHAKQFDDRYVSKKEINIYCSNEVLIKDYLIAKSLITPNTMSIVIAQPHALSQLHEYTRNAIKSIGMENRYQKLFKSYVKFKNGSKMYFFEDTLANYTAGLKFHLVYMTNGAMSQMFYSGNINYFYPSLETNGRIIYNFDP